MAAISSGRGEDSSHGRVAEFDLDAFVGSAFFANCVQDVCVQDGCGFFHLDHLLSLCFVVIHTLPHRFSTCCEK